MTGVQSLRRRALSSSFLRDVGKSYAVRIAGALTGVLTSVIIARALGAQGRGAYAVAATVSTIGIQVGNLGLHTANVHLVASRRDRAGAMLGNSLLVCAGFAVLALVAGIVMAAAGVNVEPLARGALAGALAWVVVGLFLLLLQNLALGTQDVGLFNASELLNKGIVLAGFVAITLAGRAGVTAYVVVSVVAAALGGALVCLRLSRAGLPLAAPSLPLLRTSLAYGLRNYLAAFFSYLLLRADLLMVQHYRGAGASGLYAVAVSFADTMFILPVIVGSLALARLSAIADRHARRAMTVRVALGLGAVMAAAGGLACLVVGPVIHVLFGPAFDASSPAFALLTPGIVALSVNVVFMNHFAAEGTPWLSVAIPAVAAAANLSINTVWIPRWGINGASAASSVCYALMAALGAALMLHRRPPAPATAD